MATADRRNYAHTEYITAQVTNVPGPRIAGGRGKRKKRKKKEKKKEKKKRKRKEGWKDEPATILNVHPQIRVGPYVRA